MSKCSYNEGMIILTDYARTFLRITTFQALRYFVFAGGATLLVLKARETFLQKHRIQKTSLKKADFLRELKYSLFTFFIYGLIFALIFNPHVRPLTQVYLNINEHGLWWSVLSFPALMLIHDTYFYWMHRMVHKPALFNSIHRVHHLSTNPSPLAAQSFHPIEAVLEMIWIVPLVFVFPFHQKTLFIFSFFSMIYNVYGHLSLEIMPISFRKNFVGKWLNTATHHNGHHRYYNGNYGLYFLFWDQIMNTEQKGTQ